MDTTDIEETARELEDRVRPQIEEARRRLSDINDRAVSFIKERPGATLLGALAVGFVIGRIARRA